MTGKRKIVVITCYPDPDYIRAKTLRDSLSLLSDVDLIVVKNSYSNFLRYPEVILKILLVRLRYNPDIYLLTFRGYELLPFVLILVYPKPILFDEFISLIGWLVHEHQKLPEKGLVTRIVRSLYRYMLQKCTAILADTSAHAQFSAKQLHLESSHFIPVPVSTDEKIFYPQHGKKTNNSFIVFYYGNMLPLHGISYVVDSAIALKKYSAIEFLLVGGDKKVKNLVDDAVKRGARITYKRWIPFQELPKIIASSDLCLGGPFGNTHQSNVVITGKTYQFLASAKPVIIGKNQETTIFTDFKDSLLVNQGSSKELTEKIAWAYRNKSKLYHIGVEGRKTYIKYFSIHSVSKTLQQTLEKFLAV